MIDIDFDKPYIEKEVVLAITTQEITEQYCCLSENEKNNLFFVLLSTFYQYKDEGNSKEVAAYLSYLLSYYLFVVLTPPGSEILARYYAQKAFELNPLFEYSKWYEFICQGN